MLAKKRNIEQTPDDHLAVNAEMITQSDSMELCISASVAEI
jgi:hypothetical protein